MKFLLSNDDGIEAPGLAMLGSRFPSWARLRLWQHTVPKRMGLVGPVHVSQGCGVAVEIMLGAPVVGVNGCRNTHRRFAAWFTVRRETVCRVQENPSHA